MFFFSFSRKKKTRKRTNARPRTSARARACAGYGNGHDGRNAREKQGKRSRGTGRARRAGESQGQTHPPGSPARLGQAANSFPCESGCPAQMRGVPHIFFSRRLRNDHEHTASTTMGGVRRMTAGSPPCVFFFLSTPGVRRHAPWTPSHAYDGAAEGLAPCVALGRDSPRRRPRPTSCAQDKRRNIRPDRRIHPPLADDLVPTPPGDPRRSTNVRATRVHGACLQMSTPKKQIPPTEQG